MLKMKVLKTAYDSLIVTEAKFPCDWGNRKCDQQEFISGKGAQRTPM